MKAALGFVLGFTAVFVAMGALAGTLGSFLTGHRTAVNVISGAIVAAFGLNYLGLFHINLFRGSSRAVEGELGFFSAAVFGVIFSVGWTPCVGAFLGSALMLASQQGSMLTGMGMLLCYSLGLGIPFLISAVLSDQLKGAFGWVKAHYTVINRLCGSFLVVRGIAMATGVMERLLRFLQ